VAVALLFSATRNVGLGCRYVPDTDGNQEYGWPKQINESRVVEMRGMINMHRRVGGEARVTLGRKHLGHPFVVHWKLTGY
jgi:hypothetical protein